MRKNTYTCLTESLCRIQHNQHNTGNQLCFNLIEKIKKQKTRRRRCLDLQTMVWSQAGQLMHTKPQCERNLRPHEGLHTAAQRHQSPHVLKAAVSPTGQASCSYLGRYHAGGLWLLSTASAHAPAGGSALVWELGALWMGQKTGYRCLMRRMKPFHPVWDSVTGRGRP